MAITGESARKTTILLADDESAIALLCEMDLTRRGYCVLKAHSASEATQMSEAFPTPIDVLVADWNMPDIEGRRTGPPAGETEAGDEIHPDVRLF